MQSLGFFAPGHPITEGNLSVFNGRIVHTDGPRLRDWREVIGDVAMLRSGGAQFPIFPEGAVLVECEFWLPRGKTVKRSDPSVKPDVDKLLRAVLDALTGIAYTDDAQVCESRAAKRYVGTMFANGVTRMEPGVQVRVTGLYPDSHEDQPDGFQV